MDQMRTVRNVANVVNLSTPLGLVLACAGRGRIHRVGGLLVADGLILPLRNASAMTVGSVVLIPRLRLEDALAGIPGLLEHEDAHAWQWAACLGLPFIPLYFAAAGWSMLRCGDRASANVFERQAGLGLGGYPETRARPQRTWLARLLRGFARLSR